MMNFLSILILFSYLNPSFTYEYDDDASALNNLGNYTLGKAYNSSYSPSTIAYSFHGLPHIDKEFKYTANNWSVWKPDNTPNSQYMSSLFFFPVLIGIFGMIAVIGLTCGLAHECKGVNLGPKREPVRESGQSQEEFNKAIYDWSRAIERGRQNWAITFFVSILIVLVAVHMVFIFNYVCFKFS